MSISQVLSAAILLAVIVLSACEQKYNQGKVMYEFHCAGCHLDDGTGLGELYPPLTKNDYTLENIDNFPCIITKGMKGKIVVDGKTYDGEMPLNKSLSAVEVTNIINYMNTAFDYGLAPIQLKETQENLKRCED